METKEKDWCVGTKKAIEILGGRRPHTLSVFCKWENGVKMGYSVHELKAAKDRLNGRKLSGNAFHPYQISLKQDERKAVIDFLEKKGMSARTIILSAIGYLKGEDMNLDTKIFELFEKTQSDRYALTLPQTGKGLALLDLVDGCVFRIFGDAQEALSFVRESFENQDLINEILDKPIVFNLSVSE